jgi:hypothetical protein
MPASVIRAIALRRRAQNFMAKSNTFIADVNRWSRNQSFHFCLRFFAERTDLFMGCFSVDLVDPPFYPHNKLGLKGLGFFGVGCCR